MKKVLLTLITLVGLTGFAQSQSVFQNNTLPEELRADVSEVIAIQEMVDARNKAMKAKTAGGVINKQLIGYADTLYQLNGGSATFGGLFQIPIYKDSTLRQEFSNGSPFMDQHAIGGTYDPTSIVWGANTFAASNSVTIDSLHLLGKYSASSNFPTVTGDSLIVEVVWAPRSSLTGTFNGVFFSPNATNPDTCNITTPSLTVASAGGSWKMSGTNRIRKGIALGTNDLLADADPAVLYSIAINQVIPADNLVGYAFRFKSAYSSTTAVGDTFFSTVDIENTKIPNFAGRLAQENPFTGFRYFCDFGGENTTGVLDQSTLYKQNGNFLDDIMFPSASSAYWTYITVSGTSTFDIDENTVNTEVELYPNPTSGVVNLAISQGGTYTIELVNMLGQVVHTEEVSVNGNERLTRNFSNLTKGIYLVNVKGDNYANTTKLTINK
jgi:hypothetical protein